MGSPIALDGWLEGAEVSAWAGLKKLWDTSCRRIHDDILASAQQTKPVPTVPDRITVIKVATFKTAVTVDAHRIWPSNG